MVVAQTLSVNILKIIFSGDSLIIIQKESPAQCGQGL